MFRRATGAVAVLALLLGPVVTACGADPAPSTPRAVPQNLQECREQWHEVGESVLGLDEDPHPSALASRWTSIAATIVLYENTESATNCQTNIEAQVRAITSLREFMVALRPYDMEFQLSQVAAAVDLYLNDPLPEPTKDETGKVVVPPSQQKVRAAAATLTENAARATEDLRAGWARMATVDLTPEAERAAIDALDALAVASAAWQACQSALQVIAAAITAQEGGVPAAPTRQPLPTPSPSS